MGVALSAAQDQVDRMSHVHPARSQAADGTVLELQQPLAVFVTVAVASGSHVDVGRHAGDVPHEPEKDIERMGAEIAESTNASLRGVGHPAPFGVEDATRGRLRPSVNRTRSVRQRARVTVGVSDARDLAEVPFVDLLAQEQMDRIAAHEVAGLEEDAGLLDGISHAVSILGSHAQRLLYEQVFARRRASEDKRFVAVRLGADNDALNV